MMAKRNAPAGGTAEAMTETAALTGTAISTPNFSTSGADRQPGGRIWQLLPEGEALAIPANDLMKLTGHKNSRSLRAAIDRERIKYPICASDSGYYRPTPGQAGAPELRKFIRRMDGRMASNRRSVRTAKAALRALEKAPIPGQTDLWQGGGD